MDDLTEEMHEKWHTLIERVNEAVESVFDFDADHPAIVLGVQWGDMGKDDNDLPTCVVTSNLPVCITPSAIEDMLSFAKAAHEEHHGMPVHDEERVIREDIPLDRVPEEIRQQAIEWAESLGFTAEDVRFTEVADIGDLVDEPLFGVDAEQESKEQ